MQERKNKRLALLFCVLCVGTLLIYVLGSDGGTVDIDKNIFKDYNLKEIDQVILESEKGKVELKFNGTKWVVNNQFDAEATMVDVLFATLQQAEPKRLLSATIQDSVNSALRQNGIKVSLSTGGTTESVFYAGGNFQKTQAYFCKENENDKCYLVTIPGYRVYVSGIFELPEKDWRNKYVFGFNWRNFQSLETKFPQHPADDFEVALKDNYFSVKGLSAVDTTKLNDYLDDVSLLTVEEYVNQPMLGDSVSKPLPVMVLTIKDIAQRTYSLELYQPLKTNGKVPGVINGVQWAYFDPPSIQRILKRRVFFGK
jgi:hypothetical protein